MMNPDKLTVDEIVTSEEIQSQLAPIIIEYIEEKRALIDALDWILTVIVNDQQNGLDVFENSWGRLESQRVEGEEDIGDYLCCHCAKKLGAIAPEDRICTWYTGICGFCLEETNICHSTDWDWPDDIENN